MEEGHPSELHSQFPTVVSPSDVARELLVADVCFFEFDGWKC